MRVLLSESYVRESYAHLDREEVLSAKQRVHFALLGLRTVDPLRDGSVSELESARLPDGSRAFRAKEVRHMRDVRAWLWRLLALTVGVGVALLVLSVASRRALVTALRWGAVGTAAVGIVAVVAMLVDFEHVLLAFHKLLFEGESWHFRDSDTLIRVYPERFWNWTGIAIGLLVLAQATLAFVTGEAIARRSRNARA